MLRLLCPLSPSIFAKSSQIILFLIFFKKKLYLLISKSHVVIREIYGNQAFPSILWVPEIELGSSGLAAGVLIKLTPGLYVSLYLRVIFVRAVG